MVAAEMPKLTKAMDLNEFEQAVVTSILTKYVQQRIEAQILDLGPEKTREAFENIARNQDEELKASLPEEKYEALINYQKNGGKKVKSKKKKKKKQDPK
jgi:FPC/CPF motif-containing protein YcgG